MRRRSNPRVVAALAGLMGLVLLAVLGPAFNHNSIDALDWERVAAAPGFAGAHWFGTDRLGRDLFVRALEGTRISLAVGAAASAVSLLIGLGYGAVASYAGGRIDRLMMRFIDVLSGLPLIFFVIFLNVIFGRSILILFATIGAVGWLTMARIVRGLALSLRQREYVEAAIAGGVRPARVIARHVVPNLLGPVIVYGTLVVPQIIVFESFLSFLGLGIQEPHASLGTLIADGAGEMESAPWILGVPGGLLVFMLVCLHLLGDGLRDVFTLQEP